MERLSKKQIFLNGLLWENPLLVLMLGICPALGISNRAMTGLWLGLCTALVLFFSNTLISALKRVIPQQVRIPSYMVIISTFVSIVQMLLKAYLPELNEKLGIYVPLMVVNCIILGRAEGFAGKHSVADSALDGLSMGLGYTAALVLVSSIRELLGFGTIFGLNVTANLITPMAIFTLAPGGFICFGFIVALLNKLSGGRIQRVQEENKCLGCPAAELCGRSSLKAEAQIPEASEAEEGGAGQ